MEGQSDVVDLTSDEDRGVQKWGGVPRNVIGNREEQDVIKYRHFVYLIIAFLPKFFHFSIFQSLQCFSMFLGGKGIVNYKREVSIDY